MNRRQAREAGHTRYPSASRCSRGHLGERYVSTGGCVTCTNRAPYKVTARNEARGTVTWKLILRTPADQSQAMRALGWRVWSTTTTQRRDRFEHVVETRDDAPVVALGRLMGWWD